MCVTHPSHRNHFPSPRQEQAFFMPCMPVAAKKDGRYFAVTFVFITFVKELEKQTKRRISPISI